MFTVEIKINGALISHIYGHNEGLVSDSEYQYRYEYYEVETQQLRSGCVKHNRTHGVRSLVTTILNDLEPKPEPKPKPKKTRLPKRQCPVCFRKMVNYTCPKCICPTLPIPAPI